MSSTPMRVFGDFANEAVGGITFHRVAAPSARLPPAPRFLLGSIPHQNLTNFYSLRAIGSVGVFAASGLCLSGEYILTRDNFYYRCPELNIYVPHIMQALARRVEGPLNCKKLPGQYAMITGPGHRIYGHWLVEHLPKLVLLSKAGFAVSELKFLIPESVPSFAVSWLELLGIRSEQLVRYDPNHDVIQADELLMPTIMHNGNRISDTFSDVVTFFRQQLGIWPADQAGTRFPDRIFISRARTSQTRALLNWDRIEAIAQRAGFTLVYPNRCHYLNRSSYLHMPAR